MGVDRDALLKAYKLVKGGATQAKACKKAGISLATYARHRNSLPPNGLPPKEEAQVLKAKGHSYTEIAKILKTSVSNAFKQATGKDLLDAVTQLAQERGVTRKEACVLLNIPFSNHETARRQKNKDKVAEIVEPRVKRKYTRKAKVIDIAVPTIEQVQDERKSKKSSKVIVMVCNPENLANVLKGLE